ncbi:MULTISPECIES: MaoC family dehydratase [unclassified Chromobacterium]|uniref:MaoC family dehydratase n=1 Tax=unclassified Chromobacterium TaxID=2641838 RepID=UPI001F29023B|nr:MULTISPECIES: MaoC family dehydratase [unclassified Chromobacterium]MCP1291031.1 MaoC family dehydratase [Chromobacterium sp. S0633]UJB30927.1 MaoC family dehydratase [Chromobacterium sp. Beijing]
MLYFEDLKAGQLFHSPTHVLSEDELIGFARQYDPQYFHTDPQRAADSLFGGLAASGWQTSSLSMRLVTQTELGKMANGLIGMQIDKMRWPQPTRAGDALRVTVEVLDKRRSNSQPGFGVVKVRWTTVNQRDEVAMQLECSIWAQCRTQPQAEEAPHPAAQHA